MKTFPIIEWMMALALVMAAVAVSYYLGHLQGLHECASSRLEAQLSAARAETKITETQLKAADVTVSNLQTKNAQLNESWQAATQALSDAKSGPDCTVPRSTIRAWNQLRGNLQ